MKKQRVSTEREIKKLVNELMPLLDLGGKKYLIGLLKVIKASRLRQINTSGNGQLPCGVSPYQEKSKLS